MEVQAYGVKTQFSALIPMKITRMEPRPRSILIEILWCGVCHSDVHHIKNSWQDSSYPMVPGHEIIGRIIELGNRVKSFQVGDVVAVGNMVDSCGECVACQKQTEQYCSNITSWTYNGCERYVDNLRTLLPEGPRTYGGYSTHIVSDEKFVFRLPEFLQRAEAAPLLCAGITMYTPMKKHYPEWVEQVRMGNENMLVGIAGVGGLDV